MLYERKAKMAGVGLKTTPKGPIYNEILYFTLIAAIRMQ